MPEFVWYSPSHLIVLAVTAVCAVLITLSARRLNRTADRALCLSAAAAMLVFEIIFLVIKFGSEPNKAYLFPLELCGISMYLICYLLIDYNAKLFKIAFFWAVTGSFLSLFFPFLALGFPNFRFWHFFVVHALLFLMSHYLFFRERVSLRYKDMLLSFAVLSAVALVIILPVNLIWKSNFMFIMRRPDSVDRFFAWAYPLDSVIWCLFILALFHLCWLYSRLLEKCIYKFSRR